MKSIIQPSKSRCFLCGRNGASDPLDRHHIYFGSNKKWSEKYGLTVYLCHERFHENGDESVHRNADVCRRLQRYAQRRAMAHYGWTIGQFRAVFGRNYLDEEE